MQLEVIMNNSSSAQQNSQPMATSAQTPLSATTGGVPNPRQSVGNTHLPQAPRATLHLAKRKAGFAHA